MGKLKTLKLMSSAFTKQNRGHMDQSNPIETIDEKRKPLIDLNRVDYDWVAKQTTIKDLKLAYDELEIDGCFPDLRRVVGEKMVDLDPRCARQVFGEKKVTEAEQAEIDEDMLSFLNNMNSQDSRLKASKNDIE